MTNEDKAIELIGCEGRSNCIKCGGRLSVEKGCSEFQNIIAMAQWKDEQFAAEKQALIDNACEILESIIFDKVDALAYDKDGVEFVANMDGKEFADLFRKSMEETK